MLTKTVFPAVVKTPKALHRGVKVFITSDRLVAFDRSLKRILDASFTASRNGGAATYYTVEDETWTVQKGGGCGCGSRLRSLTAEKAGVA